MAYALLDRKLRPEHELAISPADRGFLLADGVFDTLKIENGVAIEATTHMARLLRHAAVLNIAPAVSAGELCADIAELIASNDARYGDYVLRTTLTRGEGPRGIAPPKDPHPTLLMRLAPYTAPTEALKLCIARTVRRNEFSPLSKIKSLNYGDNILAMLEAKERGVDDAVLLNAHGHVTCATAGTIFAEHDNVLLTPPLSDGVMDGITRAQLIDMGRCVEKTLVEQDLISASTVYVGNSLTGLRKAVLISG